MELDGVDEVIKLLKRLRGVRRRFFRGDVWGRSGNEREKL